MKGLVNFYLGDNSVPMVHLTHPNGSTACVYLHGANVTSWTSPDGAELLHVREQTSDVAIRGGVPICFPNFGPHLSLPTDGFLKDCHWSVAETAQSPPLGVDRAPQVTLVAESDESTLQMWPHRFYAAYTVQLMTPDDFPDVTPTNRYHVPRPKEAFGSLAEASLGSSEEADEEVQPTMQLRCELQILNTDDEPFTFTTGMQSHLACRDLHTHYAFTRMLGLGGKYYIDYCPNARKPKLELEKDDYVNFGLAEVDRMYVDAYDSTVKFCPGDRSHFEVLLREGLTDLGTLNRGLTQEHNSEFAEFVVLTAAQVARPITLEPGESWKGEVALRWHDKYWEIPLFEMGPQPGGISDQLVPGFEKQDRKRKMPVLPPRRNSRRSSSPMPAV
ncbi:hypothetical protein WJX79_005540 [Trebouxia sp. C0005]